MARLSFAVRAAVWFEMNRANLSGKPRLLDLFCCAGGAAMGYHQAGFAVVGVDIKPQPRYPFEFIQADVLSLDPAWIYENFAAVHASPPCQGYTVLRHAPGARGAPKLISETRGLLECSDRPYVIENVEEARWALVEPILLCGSMFGLGAQGCELRRHRLFECSFPVNPPECCHGPGPVIGVYGGHARKRAAKHGGRGTRDVWDGGHAAAAREALGMDWATLAEMSEAIPPAFTRFIGRRLLGLLQDKSIAA